MQLEESPKLERRSRRVERAGSVLGLALFALALSGVFGKGPLAHATAQGPQGWQVDYDRFVWTASSTNLQVQLPKDAHGPTNVALSSDYLKRVAVGNVDPQPTKVTTLGDRTIYTVDAGPSGQVSFYVVPEHIGLTKGTVWTAHGSVTFHQWVYP